MNLHLRGRSTRAPALLAAALAASVTLAACGSSGTTSVSNASATSSASGAATGTLNWAYLQDEPNWDPVVVGATSATQLLSLIYEPLFSLEPNGDIGPAVATSYKYNTTGTAVTITLRPGLTFQDGSPLNAAAVAYDINRAKTQTNSALKSDYSEIASETVINDTTLRLNLAEKDYQIPFILANRTSLLASEKAAKANLENLDTSDPVGAGPFKLVKLIPDASITLEKWPGYWDAKDVHIKTVTVSMNVNPATLLSGMQTGTYNFATDFPAQDISSAKSDGLNVVANEAANWAADFVSFNRNKAPFNNPDFVQAFEDAINRQQFVSQLTFGTGTASVQPLPTTSPAYNPALNSLYSYNPTKAKQLLAKSGYTAHPTTITVNTIAGLASGATELLQQQLAAVGIKSTIDTQTIDAFYDGYYGKTDTAALYGYVGRDSKLEALDENFGTQGILNLSAPYQSAQYTAARQKVLGTPLTSPNYLNALKAATAAGVENGTQITLYTSPEAYATATGFSAFPVIDGSFRWNGLTISK